MVTPSKTSRLLAAKTDMAEGRQWLPLWMHSYDTAEVMAFLVTEYLPESIRAEIGPGDTAERIGRFLGWVHDIGMATVLFQSHILQCLPAEVSERVSKNLRITGKFRFKRESLHARAGECILLSLGCAHSLASIVGANHGLPQANKFCDLIEDQMEMFPENFWYRGERNKWEEIWIDLYDTAQKQSGLSSCSLQELPVSTQILLSGLLIVADWIASNTEYFPLIPVSDIGQESEYPQRIESALQALPIQNCLKDQISTFLGKAADLPYNPCEKQAVLAAERARAFGLFIFESRQEEMRSNAILHAAQIIAQASGAQGIVYASSPCTFKQEEKECEQPKSYINEKLRFLDNFVVCPLEKLLACALKQRHFMLYHLGLIGKVVAIDATGNTEACQSPYLDYLLAWLGVYRVPTILVVKTISVERKSQLIKAYSDRSMPFGGSGMVAHLYSLDQRKRMQQAASYTISPMIERDPNSSLDDLFNTEMSLSDAAAITLVSSALIKKI